MNKIKITCDSTCDLTRELYEKYNVEVIPLEINLGGEFFADGVTITADKVFSYVSETGVLPKTSAIPTARYSEVFKKYTDEGYSVIHINISSEFSACHQNALNAAKELTGVYPIDSRNLSTGSGHLVIAASEMAEDGMEASEIAAKLDEIKEKVDASFVLQTLEYLKKGGRCSSLAALGASILQLCPEIEVVEGTMRARRKYRGKIKKTISDYIKGRIGGRDDIELKRAFITHSGVAPEIVEEMKALVLELQPFEELLETVAGCTVSSHCGPECLGVLFFTK
ncbi:MAG: DegV family protein [Clostridia bacterium]|nr:DegV family protein [Clostridia bacterium]